MASPDKSAPIPDDSEGGELLGQSRMTAADLYDPATGKALLIPGAPLDPPPPTADQVRIGFIDSGILANHPQLRNLVVAQRDFTGNDPIDRVGHGTLVAFSALEQHYKTPKQLATKDPELAAKLAGSPAFVSAKVTGPTGKIEVGHVIEAIHWMAQLGVRVVNMSLGFRGRKERYAGLCEAIAQYAAQPNKGITFVAAAGNFGPNVLVYPAACDGSNVISVGAVIDSQEWAQSGKGDIYAEGRVQAVPASVYHYEGAQEAARTGDYGRAREGYHASLEAEENAPALFGLALLDLHSGDLESAYDALTRAAQLSPNDPEIESHLGSARLMQQRPAEARAHFYRALALDPKNVRALTNRSIALVQLGEPGLALQDLAAARPLTDERSRIDAMIVDVLKKLGALPPGTKLL